MASINVRLQCSVFSHSHAKDHVGMVFLINFSTMVPFVDMDGVIADAYEGHIDGCNQEFQGNLSKDACYGKGFWQCVPASHRKSVQNHAGCKSFFKDLGVMGNSQQVLEKLNQNHTVSIA